MSESNSSPRLLILGGTRFIGPHIVEEAQRRGYTVTLFNRGKSNPGLFADIEQLHGDRDDGDYASLEGRSWEAVIDTSAYYPRAVEQALEVLAANIEHYLLISTISVYADFGQMGLDEDSALATLDDPTTEEVTGQTYGGLKVLCEEAAAHHTSSQHTSSQHTSGQHTSGRLTIIRPGVVAGPRDHTDRFTYWPVRTSRGGRMLVPGAGDDPAQYIDARDLAAWCLDTIDEEIEGTFNAVIPRDSVTMSGLISASKKAADKTGAEPAEPVFVDEEFLLEQDAGREFPMWAPKDSPSCGIYSVSAERALAAGMQTRPVDETARDTLAWFQSLPKERQDELEAGPSADREQELLEAWEAQ